MERVCNGVVHAGPQQRPAGWHRTEEDLECPPEEGGLILCSEVAGLKFWRGKIRFAIEAAPSGGRGRGDQESQR